MQLEMKTKMKRRNDEILPVRSFLTLLTLSLEKAEVAQLPRIGIPDVSYEHITRTKYLVPRNPPQFSE